MMLTLKQPRASLPVKVAAERVEEELLALLDLWCLTSSKPTKASSLTREASASTSTAG